MSIDNNGILMTGFRGTSSEQFVKKQTVSHSRIILPNDKILDAKILLDQLQRSPESVKYIFSFGQKPNIKDKIYIETAARSGSRYLYTEFAYDELHDAFRTEHIEVRLSDRAGTSFCNALYWNVLKYIYDQGLQTKMIFLHMPFRKNITASGDFYERIQKGIGNYLLNSADFAICREQEV